MLDDKSIVHMDGMSAAEMAQLFDGVKFVASYEERSEDRMSKVIYDTWLDPKWKLFRRVAVPHKADRESSKSKAEAEALCHDREEKPRHHGKNFKLPVRLVDVDYEIYEETVIDEEGEGGLVIKHYYRIWLNPESSLHNPWFEIERIPSEEVDHRCTKFMDRTWAEAHLVMAKTLEEGWGRYWDSRGD